MTCSPPVNDPACGGEESTHGFKLSSTPCENLPVNQAEPGGKSHDEAFQSGGSSRIIALEQVPNYGSDGYSNSAIADDQVQTLDRQLPLQHDSETELQLDVCLEPALAQVMADESAWNSYSSLLLLPTETADQSTQGHESRRSETTGDDSLDFGAELRMGTDRPDSGQPSRQHNAIPWTEILLGTVEVTKLSDADASLEDRSLGLTNKDISASREFQAPAATSGGSGLNLAARHGGRSDGDLENIDSDNSLRSLVKNPKTPSLVKNPKTPGSGGPSHGHN